MERVIRIVTLLLLCSCGGSDDPVQHEPAAEQEASPERKQEERTPFNVVFYNVENLFDTENDPVTDDDDFTPDGRMRWTEGRYEHKLLQLAKAISMTGKELPLVIGLCEVENRQVVEDLAGTPPLDRLKYSVIHQDSPDERGIDVALLVSPKLGEVAQRGWLPVVLGRDRTRDVLFAEVRTRSGDALTVFVNHWPSRGEGLFKSAPKRMKAARTLRTAVDAVLAKDPHAAIIIMGDLNDEPQDASVVGGLEAVAPDRADVQADLFDLVLSDQGAPRGSISHQGQWQYFDHMIVSSALVSGSSGGFHALSAASVKDDRLIFHHREFGDQPNRTYSGDRYHADGFSDHLPVVLRLE